MERIFRSESENFLDKRRSIGLFFGRTIDDDDDDDDDEDEDSLSFFVICLSSFSSTSSSSGTSSISMADIFERCDRLRCDDYNDGGRKFLGLSLSILALIQ
ncbi:hypothetical protein DERP_003234 [Dermatophagoides pteronyssinus]|uniref:Uncharacterized protein n=1 Tax=Dermatophagoides pteronyssinus TaxID=6956 RepID=A0ABQ8JIW8_DERPT|nr:hypothetical protein DERP_003234 [Dermatophagoides pteronyssinus]